MIKGIKITIYKHYLDLIDSYYNKKVMDCSIFIMGETLIKSAIAVNKKAINHCALS